MNRPPIPYIVRAVDNLSSNARHRFGVIKVRRHLTDALAKLAQEMREEDELVITWYAWIVPLVFTTGLLIALLINGSVLAWLAASSGVAVVSCLRLPRLSNDWMRQMEYRGHATEIAWKHRYMTIDKPLDDQIFTAAVGLLHYDQMEGVSLKDVCDGIRRELPAAIAWVDTNGEAIRSAHAHKFPYDRGNRG